MAGEKPCSKLQSFFMTEGQRIVKRRMRGHAGEKVEAQIANAAIDLDLPYITCWRAYQGRCGERAFRKIYAAETALMERERDADTAGAILARLAAVEQTLASLREQISAVALEGADMARRDERGSVRRLGLVGAAAGASPG